jgi:PPP family 3-phenylpropionic acid transporter
MKKRWMFSANLLLTAGIVSIFSFLVLYFQSLGFTGAQIGLLSGMGPLITFFSAPLWTGLADATHRHRLLMSLAIMTGAIGLSVFPLLRAFTPVLLLSMVLSFFTAPVTPFLDSATLHMLGDERQMYSRMRLGGTIGLGLAAPTIARLVEKHGLAWSFWSCAALLLLGLVVSQKLDFYREKADRAPAGGVRLLLSNPRWLLFLAMAFAGGAAHLAVTDYLFAYMKELGASVSMMGLAFTVGTLSEIAVLFLGHRLIARFESHGLLMLSTVVTGLRLILLAVCSTPGLVLWVQLLNGLTFPAMYVAAASYADQNAPTGMNTSAQGLLSATVFGLGMAAGGFLGGPLLGSLGGRGLYLAFGTAVLAIAVAVTLLERRLPAKHEASVPPVAAL